MELVEKWLGNPLSLTRMNVAGSDNKAEAAVVPGAVVLSVLRCSKELVTSEC